MPTAPAPGWLDEPGAGFEVAQREVGGIVEGFPSSLAKRRVLVGKGGLYGNVIRTGMMLNSTKDHVDELIEALDASFAAVSN